MSNTTISLLKELCEAHSPPGHEDEVRSIFRHQLGELGQVTHDGSGNLFHHRTTIDHSDHAPPRVVVTGHMDEIGFMVQNITSDGLIQFVPLGGWWTHSLLAQRVSIKNRENRKITGLVTSRPPHFLPAELRNNVQPIESLFIDVGATQKAQVTQDLGIRVGDPITPDSQFTPLDLPNHFMAKAFDNRLGIAGTIETAQRLHRAELPCQLIATATVQEEVGLRGARTAANSISPDCVIVLEAPPADDFPQTNPNDWQGRLGGGVQIRRFDPTAIANPKFANFVIDTAEDLKIKHQVTVRRSGGTDAGSFHLANQGIPTIVLGTPARNIHSHNAIINLADYLAMVELTCQLVKSLDRSTINSFISY